VPVTQTAPPPVSQALVVPFQVSLPGSPGAGTVNLRQATLPVAASTAASQSRSPSELPDAPNRILSLIASGAPRRLISGTPNSALVSQTILPLSLSVARMRA